MESFKEKDYLPTNYSYTENRIYLELNQKSLATTPRKEKNNESLPPKIYWSNLGLISSQCATDTISPNATALECLKDFEFYNSEFFNNFYNEPTSIPLWSIDGTCATGKSSCIPEYTIKTNRELVNLGLNTHPHASLGYYFSSCKILKTYPSNMVSDRTPYNNMFPWIQIWLMISDSQKPNADEVYTSCNSYGQFLNETYDTGPMITDRVLNTWRSYLTQMNMSVQKEIFSTTKCILLVDSDENRSILRLRNRNTGSDYDRSFWDNYITMQNYAYAYMAATHPTKFCILDVNKYHGNLDVVQQLVRDVLHKYTITATKHKTMNFKPLRPNVPIHYILKDYEQYERVRPMLTRRFYDGIKHVNLE